MCAKKCAGRPSNRDAILDAAEQLVASEGAARLTFDALGQATGISKGGLLYHFASKDKLLEAMLERMVARNSDLKDAFMAQFEGDPNQELKSILLASLNSDAECAQLSSGLLAAAANNPELLAPMTAHVQQTFRSLEQFSNDPMLAKVLFFAVHGARLFEQLQLCEHCQGDRKAFADKLLAMIDEQN